MKHDVLIVEDEPNIADALRFLLVHQGFDVTVETDGARALSRFESVQPDVVVLDVMLPNRSGFDVLRDLRARSNEPPVLMLTAIPPLVLMLCALYAVRHRSAAQATHPPLQG